jgi:hypothetical protein
VNLKVEVKNAILGDSVFWEGPSEKLEDIRNIPARDLARQVAVDGQTRKSGMWVVSALPNAPLHLQGGAAAEPCKCESGCSQGGHV